VTFQAVCSCGYTSQDFKFMISADVVSEYHLDQKKGQSRHVCVTVEMYEDLEHIGSVSELSSAY
jgi:hypothetical protein